MTGAVVGARARCSSCDGQSSVELLGLLPLIAVVTLAAFQLLATGLTRTAASSAAEAAAMALLQGQDPATAARAATPRWTHRHLTVRVDGRHVHVRITPPGIVPGTAGLLVAEAEADAGPAATASVAPALIATASHAT
jgi:hypothetical protein